MLEKLNIQSFKSQKSTRKLLELLSDCSKFAGYKASKKKAIDSSQIIIPYTLKLYSAVCQLYLIKTGRKSPYVVDII